MLLALYEAKHVRLSGTVQTDYYEVYALDQPYIRVVEDGNASPMYVPEASFQPERMQRFGEDTFTIRVTGDGSHIGYYRDVDHFHEFLLFYMRSQDVVRYINGRVERISRSKD